MGTSSPILDRTEHYADPVQVRWLQDSVVEVTAAAGTDLREVSRAVATAAAAERRCARSLVGRGEGAGPPSRWTVWCPLDVRRTPPRTAKHERQVRR